MSPTFIPITGKKRDQGNIAASLKFEMKKKEAGRPKMNKNACGVIREVIPENFEDKNKSQKKRFLLEEMLVNNSNLKMENILKNEYKLQANDLPLLNISDLICLDENKNLLIHYFQNSAFKLFSKIIEDKKKKLKHT